METALGALARRAMTAAEIGAHLRRKGFPRAEIESAILRLVELDYVNDARLTAAFIGTRAVTRGLGPGRVRAELARRGVAREVIDAELSRSVESGEASPSDAARALEKIVRVKGIPKDRKERDRVRAALARRGFSMSSISRAMTELAKREDERGGES
ncbi:MAG TPA: RecX family transcriptional regulator [Verrucomicrobiae bacterium]|nr:RecX family transcriptional regulator [Verrucomicrobiae bacterium]